MSAPLLVTKLHIPPLPPGLTPRPRLVERLDQSLGQVDREGAFARKLTLLSAPAGFGKTTLLSEWLHTGRQAMPPLQAAWLSLDGGDGDPARFLAYVVAALQRLQPSLGKGLLVAFGAPQPPPSEAVLVALINELASLPEPAVLILDDYHLVEAQAIHDLVAFLLDRLPPTVHLVIATRADPPLPLARLRGRRQMTELRVDDLRFTPDEAAVFLNQEMGLALTAEDISALESRTEGWIAGLQLAALSLAKRSRGKGPREASGFIQAFAGDDRYVVDYLVEEVLQGQTEQVQRFLLQTSILSRLSAPLCDAVRFGGAKSPSTPEGDAVCFGKAETQSSSLGTAVRSAGNGGTGQSDSWTTLQYLDQANLFLVALDQKRAWYRYHQLFADLLRQRLQRTHPEQIAVLHRRAAQWYEENGFQTEAIGHALAARDHERAAQLIVGAFWETLAQGQRATVLGWLGALPEEMVRAQPRLALTAAWASLAAMELDAVEPHLQDAERVAPVIGPVPALLGEIATIRTTLASLWGDVPQIIELGQQALAHLPEENAFLRGMVTNALGTGYEVSGETQAASEAFAQAADLSRRAGNPVITMISLCNLGRMQELQGQLHQAEDTYCRALRYAAGQGEEPLPVTGLAHVGLGALRLEWNDLPAASDHLQEGLALGQRLGIVEIQVIGHAVLAQVQQAKGDAAAALEAIVEAQRLAQHYRVSAGTTARVAAIQTRLWIMHRDLQAAAQWARQSRPGTDAGLTQPLEFEQITWAWLLLAQGEPAQAEESLVRLLAVAEAQGRLGNAVEILALLALTRQALGQPSRALDDLARALSLAEPAGYVRTFVDKGPPMAALLDQLASAEVAPGFVRRLLAAFDPGKALDADQPGPSPALPLVEPLSVRELEVLERIAAGLSNREIAAELFITVGTVKWHVNNIFGKLQVKRRTEAVARARELGLL